ncbi:methylmalonyl-CoA mutase family protein [Oleiharenicola sp. Vm1]|uniref:methylmalonyl-CoA mutase family protein n=1 Tax=Oleiharenicola sp. Vm1 TaxID=3398393 RepID=UPI0039F5085D
MSQLGKIADSVETYNAFVRAEVARARTDAAYAAELRTKWEKIRASVDYTSSPTGTKIPRLALPDTDEPGAIADYLLGQGLPGQFPYATAAYREMYLDRDSGTGEEPMRLFAGLGLAEDTNARFKYLSRNQKSIRLSTAFDGPTLYGLDSDHEGVLGKVGEGGVAIDTVEDMQRLFAGFDLTRKDASVSMTMNAPAPIILAMFIAAAKRRFGADCVPNLRGTIQADMLKEVQAQNEVIFPVDASLRFLGDMMEWCVPNMPRWYPVSISGYHIAEAGATPVQQAAFTLSNGFTYVELLKQRGADVNAFGPRLSFFLDCGLDVEYLVLGRVCRRIWAIGMRDVFGADAKAQILKLHTQTSGRSLIAAEFQNNLTRTAVELMLAYMNYTNSCHSNSADEPFTTPTEKYALLASHGQSIILEESGVFKHMMNMFGGAPGLLALERQVEKGILDVFREMDTLGGVIAAMEQRYQRSKIQEAGHAYEKQIYAHERPIIGLNKYVSEEAHPNVPLARTPPKKQRLQVERLKAFKKKHAKKAPEALQRLENVARNGGNVFGELVNTVEVCSLGQITACLTGVVGKFRPMV